MGEFARVESIDALKDFRIALCKFTDTIKIALGEADAEIQRVDIWLKQDQARYWKDQLRKRTELLHRAKMALKEKKLQKTPLGGRYSCVDEEKAVAAAQRNFDEAEQKCKNVQRWIKQLDHEVFNYQGLVQGLDRAMDTDMPVALAQLDRILDSLDAYVGYRKTLDEAVSQAQPLESMRREEPLADVVENPEVPSKESETKDAGEREASRESEGGGQ